MDGLTWYLSGLFCGGIFVFLAIKHSLRISLPWKKNHRKAPIPVSQLIGDHFDPVATSEITVSERQFPFRVRADLQRSINLLFGKDTKILHFFGVRREYSHEGLALSECLIETNRNPVRSIPPEYEELDIGEDEPVRVLKNGLWLLEKNGIAFVVLLSPSVKFGVATGLTFQVGTPNSPEGTQLAQEFFKVLENSILKSESYRGKILSLDEAQHSYSGESCGIQVHQLRSVARDEVILPEATISLLDRNVIQFVQQRERLAEFQQSTRKGILFYGPPGTGKTHTIHYLASALEDHTTLLISAEQVALLSEYMTLARLLQPSMVIIEDVDLIARDRAEMNSPCEEVLLNKLLNEMDGLKEDADIIFILTTNRPESLEAALASRPGRVDQAIEFPLPDPEGRKKLVSLYSKGISLDRKCITEIVSRTSGVSASFIKELMRRIVQYHIERKGDGTINQQDIESALDEMLSRGGVLNRKLLGAPDT